MRFEFATAQRVVFGCGTLPEAAAVAGSLGRNVLLVTGRTPERASRLAGLLASQPMAVTRFGVQGEPTIADIKNGIAVGREARAEVVVGFGGGSALDAAKAIAVFLMAGEGFERHLEVVGVGEPLARPGLPCIAIPTTAGTGAEVTRNSVLASPQHRVKVSVRSAFLLPRLALVDPELTLGLPPAVTAGSGMDALAQLIEAYVSVRSNPLADGLCVEGLRRVSRSLRRAYEAGDDSSAREDLALGSLLSGMALANAGLGAVHGLAAPIGGRLHAPHGAVCAALLAGVMEANVRALRERGLVHPGLARYDEVARLLTGRPQAEAADGLVWVRELSVALGVVPLSRHGMTASDVPVLVDQASRANSMKSNPVSLTREELSRVLLAAL